LNILFKKIKRQKIKQKEFDVADHDHINALKAAADPLRVAAINADKSAKTITQNSSGRN